MNDSSEDDLYAGDLEPEISTEPGGCFAEFVRRAVLALLALIVIVSMLSNLVALPETLETPSRSDIGLTETQIVERYGPPDSRSSVQSISPNQIAGSSPRRLAPGEQYFSMRYEEGPLILVFHLVSPEIYLKYNSYRPDTDEWVVIERFIGASNVIY
ncbi:MAG: hypothetical protein PVH60_10265 [Anaerolineales bacterium]